MPSGLLVWRVSQLKSAVDFVTKPALVDGALLYPFSAGAGIEQARY